MDYFDCRDYIVYCTVSFTSPAAAAAAAWSIEPPVSLNEVATRCQGIATTVSS